MIIQTHVREQVFPISVKNANQTYKWLGMVACYRYAMAHSFTWNFKQFIPVNIEDDKQKTLFPNVQIKDCLRSEVFVQILGPHLGANSEDTCPIVSTIPRPLSSGSLKNLHTVREKSLWERFAFASEEEWTEITFVFDVDAELGEKLTPRTRSHLIPEIVGNFTGWETPMAMRRVTDKEHVFEYHNVFPQGAQLVFKFVINDVEVVGKEYDTVKDSAGEELNYLRVKVPHLSFR